MDEDIKKKAEELTEYCPYCQRKGVQKIATKYCNTCENFFCEIHYDYHTNYYKSMGTKSLEVK